MNSSAKTVADYLDGLPAGRREAIEAVRKVIRKNLPKGYEETVNWGMITYQVPLSVFPDTYNKQPLMYAALASQKNYMSVYLMGIYGDSAARKKFEAAYRKSGKRMDVGKSCVRFRTLDDLPLDLIGESISAVGVDEFIRMFEKAGSIRKSGKK